MTELLYILENISLPIVILIVVGFVFRKLFQVNVKSYSKLLLYLITPVVIFTKLYNADITWAFFIQVMPFVLLLMLLLYGIGQILCMVFQYKKSMRNAFLNSIILFNSGNYGIPLIELAFQSNPIATASQLFIVLIQNIIGNTLGVFHVCAGQSDAKQAVKNMIKMPSLYAILIVLIIKSTHIAIPNVIMLPLEYMTDAFISLALITLGIQLADVKVGDQFKQVMVASAVRIIVAPLLGFGLVLLLGIKGILAQALIIGISTPTAVNTAILAKEFDNESDFAAQIVLMTTIFVTLTLPLIIFFVRRYF